MFDLPTEESVITGVTKYVASAFGGDWLKAFDATSDKNGNLDKDKLVELLRRADVGIGVTRGAIARRIVARLDKNNDGLVSRDEFLAVFNAPKG